MKLRRKREGKTDYKKRLGLIKSEKPRLVVRKLSRMITAQIIKYEADGDKTLVTTTSKEIAKLGYQGNRKNTPAGYLVGLIIAKKAQKAGITEVVPDIGFHAPSKGATIFSVLKGTKDGGLKMNLDEKILPTQERLYGEHISPELAKKVRETKEKLKQ